MIGLIAATANGRRNAAHLAGAWSDTRLYEGNAKEALDRAWYECDGIVLFLATGAALRSNRAGGRAGAAQDAGVEHDRRDL